MHDEQMNSPRAGGCHGVDLVRVSKRYGDTVALHPSDLTIKSGQTTVLIGPSGSGKSTILRLIIRLVAPTSGTIRLAGVVLDRDNIRSLRHRMGYVIQDGGLFPHLTARGNTTLLARHLGWDRERIERRLTELVSLTRFPLDALDRYPAPLSGGQRQRVGLMRALMLDPDLLLLDEPLGALDPMIRSDLQDDLKNIFKTLGKTVVFVTHDLSEARFFGDTIVLLGEGRIVQQGKFEEFIRAPADPFVTSFINAQRSRLDGVDGAVS